MINLLKKIYWTVGDYYNDEVNLSVLHKKTGLNGRDKKKLKNHTGGDNSSVMLHGYEFFFSHGESLFHSIEEIFLQEVYKFKPSSNRPLIIDCGANLGVSLMYFKMHFPEARIIAFEPDQSVFKLLTKNVAGFKNGTDIELHEKAVWHEDTTLSFFSQGALSGSLVTDFAQNNNLIEVKAENLNKYLQQAVDFLKIDIEGAENELIFAIADNLRNVEYFFLEYHSLKGEEQKLGEILSVIKDAGFEYYIKLASDPFRFPFLKEESRNSFNMQLNIFCYRKFELS